MTHALGQIMIFFVYMFAMLGLIVFAFFIWRKTNIGSFNQNKGNMKIEESLCLSPRKTLLIINVDNERILIASDSERTTFLTKLNGKENINDIVNLKTQSKINDNDKGINILQELIKKRGV